jgi:hypothetical protein
MPNLINDNGYNGLGGLAQNYRRVRVGNSQLGTRQLQMYEIWVYGLSDALADNYNMYNGSREIVLDNTEDMDQPPMAELAAGNIVEAILRGVQEMAEIYMVGQVDYYHIDPDYNNLVITVVVGADTVESWQEQNLDNNGQNYNPNSQTFSNAIGDSVDAWAIDHSEDWEGLDVYPTYLQGDGTSYYGMYALAKLDPVNVAVKDAQRARGAAMKAARTAAGKVSYTPKSKR